MGKNVILSNEGAIQFNQALGLLNMSIRELSQIADNLVPENLIKNGFARFMEEFCNSMEIELDITVKFSEEGDQFTVSERLEIILYRCFKVIVSTLFRFFTPQEVLVKLKYAPQTLYFVVEDNEKPVNEHPQYALLKTELDKIKEILDPVDGYFQMHYVNNIGNTFMVTIQA